MKWAKIAAIMQNPKQNVQLEKWQHEREPQSMFRLTVNTRNAASQMVLHPTAEHKALLKKIFRVLILFCYTL